MGWSLVCSFAASSAIAQSSTGTTSSTIHTDETDGQRMLMFWRYRMEVKADVHGFVSRTNLSATDSLIRHSAINQGAASNRPGRQRVGRDTLAAAPRCCSGYGALLSSTLEAMLGVLIVLRDILHQPLVRITLPADSDELIRGPGDHALDVDFLCNLFDQPPVRVTLLPASGELIGSPGDHPLHVDFLSMERVKECGKSILVGRSADATTEHPLLA
ncbi:uncharacterized protein N7515_009082 [Penicillium bovifimosum]|uniref:Uncharacterized protein n=1 Tax=Penicillium bovifimosum TaxID=126998 RepID=A0A9W9GJ22_9EURO|nr:uncharacterized protein N7515_009082 [Penicillium bovifimosum]KAJ5121121.1 hypothetical protein N7515_009082 [Penicillium bovifimosum]